MEINESNVHKFIWVSGVLCHDGLSICYTYFCTYEDYLIWILKWNNAIALLQDFLFAHGDLILEGWWVPWTLHCCLNLICVRCGFDLIECRCEGRLLWNGSIIDIIICYCMYLSINILRSFKLNLCLHGSLNCPASLNLLDQIILSSPCRWMNISIFRQYVVQSTSQ